MAGLVRLINSKERVIMAKIIYKNGDTESVITVPNNAATFTFRCIAEDKEAHLPEDEGGSGIDLDDRQAVADYVMRHHLLPYLRKSARDFVKIEHMAEANKKIKEDGRVF